MGRSLVLVRAFSAGSSEVLAVGDESAGMGQNSGGRPSASLAFGVSGRPGIGWGGRPVVIHALR